MTDSSEDPLRREIGFLGKILGDIIRESAGGESFAIVERLRRAAWDRRVGTAVADESMQSLVSTLDETQLRVVIRAFTVFLDLLNVVEDRRRVQVIAERVRDAYPEPPRESIRDAMDQLKRKGVSAEQMQSLIDRLHVELVFTAHPTEAKRRSVRSKLKAVRDLMYRYDRQPPAGEQVEIGKRLRAEVSKLWHTDFLRPWRPSVMQEVERGLSFKSVIWREVPRISQEISESLREKFGDRVKCRTPCLTFGSWIGGDRDGHPGVTADVTEETFVWLRREAIKFHLEACDSIFSSLTLSARQLEIPVSLRQAIDSSTARWPQLGDRIASIPPDELFRRWLSIIRWRLEQTLSQCASSLTSVREADADAAYRSGTDLADDVKVVEVALSALPASRHVMPELRHWQDQIDSFGLHLARLDVRQNAKVHTDVLNDILGQCGLNDRPESLTEQQRCQLLSETFELGIALTQQEFSSVSQESVTLFRVLHRVEADFSAAAIGTLIISMTSAASDVLTVLWFWRQTRDQPTDELSNRCPPIVPLLETIDDLERGPSILRDLLANPLYRDHLRSHGDRQVIMLGYSDSTKDGGYLSACWSLYQTQQSLTEIADEHGIALTFFHGRGGSLGRGGGPTARSILSLPPGTFRGTLRLTEQGEVLADRYDDDNIAHRHLEQVIWSSLLAAGDPAEIASSRWQGLMDTISARSFAAYRGLVEQPRFVEFFRMSTPISAIEQMPIGSRPSRRKPDGGLADLRAIPWVFSWTQCRCLLPAWYGIGSAMAPLIEDELTRLELQLAYQQWPFFRALVDNAELALAKSDSAIAAQYAKLAGDEPALVAIAGMIADEFEKSRIAVLALTKRDELLDGIPWLKESIRVRNRYIDPLNLIQVELLRRARSSEDDGSSEELRHLTRLSINGIAAGMRTSG